MGTVQTAYAAELKNEFDSAFARPIRAGTAAQGSDFLAIAVNGHPYALLMSEIRGLHADRAIVPVPSPVPELLGLAGIRGELIPVYSLAALLGYGASGSAGSTDAPARWLVSCCGQHSLGLAFDVFERHLNSALPQGPAAGGAKSEHVQTMIRADVSRPVISIPSIIATISRRCPPAPIPTKEK